MLASDLREMKAQKQATGQPATPTTSKLSFCFCSSAKCSSFKIICCIRTIMEILLSTLFIMISSVSVHGRIEYLTHGSLYSMSHQEASNQCAARGGSLALPHDLYLAKQSGVTHCACGWLADKSARFPSSVSVAGCGGRPGVHICSWQNTWNAYCFFGGPVENCSKPLGMENGAIRDPQLSSSSTYHAFWNERWDAHLARLNKQGVVNAWMPHHDGRNQYVEVDLGRPYAITGIITQGVRRYLKNQYVTRFRVASSKDGQRWTYYTGGTRTAKIFDGNRDNNGLKRNMFSEAILAQHFRVYPYSWVKHISLRFELLGCEMEVYDHALEKLREGASAVLEY